VNDRAALFNPKLGKNFPPAAALFPPAVPVPGRPLPTALIGCFRDLPADRFSVILFRHEKK